MGQAPATDRGVVEVGIILAGGRSRRMGGGDKCLRPLGGRPILAHVAARARSQVRTLLLGANGDPARFADYGLTVVADPVADAPGPLAGVLAGLEWAAAHASQSRYVASFTADAPFIPVDLVTRLAEAAVAADADIAFAVWDGQRHPATGLWRVSLREKLRTAITEERFHRVADWAARHRLVEVAFPAAAADPFLNINTAADLEAAEKLLQEGQAL